MLFTNRSSLTLSVRIAVLFLTGFVGSLCANADGYAHISHLKAAYYYNALKFTQWPEDSLAADTSMNILLIGNDDVCAILSKKLPQYSILGRKVQLDFLPSLQTDNWLDNEEAVSTLDRAHAIYFADNTLQDYPGILDTLKHPVLTGSSIPDFAHHGGMVEITLDKQQQKLVFHINAYNLKQSDMSMSSQLLKISTIINPNSYNNSNFYNPGISNAYSSLLP